MVPTLLIMGKLDSANMLFLRKQFNQAIDEYIEISKQYSTPKSKEFINGILDTIANKDYRL